MARTGGAGFLGFGNMAQAIANGLLDKRAMEAHEIAIFDTDPDKQAMAREHGLTVAESPEALAAAGRGVLVLAVKPQQMTAALEPLRPGLPKDPLVVSVAAGLTTAFIDGQLGGGFRVIRAMPNTPALVGAGITAICGNAHCSGEDLQRAKVLFEAVGAVEEVPEELMDAVTAVSGSGPAYFFYLAEALAEAGRQEGLPPEQAARLAAHTLHGAGALIHGSEDGARSLRERVTSKGGTTEAALNAMRAAGFEAAVRQAAAAAVRRARELAG